MNFKESLYKEQGKISLFMFIYEIPKLLILLFSSLEFKAIIVWLELIHCLGDTFNSLIVLLCHLLGKNKHNLNDTKIEIIETIVGIVCDVAIMMGLGSMIAFSTLDIFHPHKSNSNLLFVIIVAIISIVFDFVFLKETVL